MIYRQVAKGYSAKALLAIAFLVEPVSLLADIVLPTSASCSAADFCSASAAQLPAVNGIQCTKLTFGGSSSSSDEAQFSFQILGALDSGIPTGILIPYTFSFNADSRNESGTNIIGSYLFADGDQTSTSTITFDGNCAPFPNALTNTHWCRSVQGSGTVDFPQVNPSGFLQLGATIEIDTVNIGGNPIIVVEGEISFNPVPEPRYPALVLLGLALLTYGYKLRTTP